MVGEISPTEGSINAIKHATATTTTPKGIAVEEEESEGDEGECFRELEDEERQDWPLPPAVDAAAPAPAPVAPKNSSKGLSDSSFDWSCVGSKRAPTSRRPRIFFFLYSHS